MARACHKMEGYILKFNIKIFKVLWLSGLSEVLLILFTEVQVLLEPKFKN